MRTTTSLVARWLAGGAALLALGCDGIVPPGNNGELNNGVFSYSCDSDSDPVCDGAGNEALGAVPAKVAVGSRFTLKYTPSPFGDDSGGGSTTVEPAAKALLTQTETFGSSFKALKPGLCAILARRGSVVTDFLHVRVGAIDHLQVDASGITVGATEGVQSLELTQDDQVTLRAFPVDEADELLAGALSAGWTSDDESVATFDTIATDNQVTVRAVGAGSTTLRVEVEDLTQEIEVVVAAGGVE